jgi:hypothetical protein
MIKMYIDPGTGSILIQVLAAAIPVAVATIFAFRNKIRGLFGKPPIERKNKPEAGTPITMVDDAFEVIDDN